MSWSSYMANANQITKAGYYALGGCNNPNLYSRINRNGSHRYITYHLMGVT